MSLNKWWSIRKTGEPSLEQISKKLKCTPSHVRKILAGERLKTIGQQQEIARLLLELPQSKEAQDYLEEFLGPPKPLRLLSKMDAPDPRLLDPYREISTRNPRRALEARRKVDAENAETDAEIADFSEAFAVFNIAGFRDEPT